MALFCVKKETVLAGISHAILEMTTKGYITANTCRTLNCTVSCNTCPLSSLKEESSYGMYNLCDNRGDANGQNSNYIIMLEKAKLAVQKCKKPNTFKDVRKLQILIVESSKEKNNETI